MKIELDRNMIFNEETGEDICALEDLKGELLEQVINALIAEKYQLSDEVLHLSYKVEQLEEEKEEILNSRDDDYYFDF